MMQRYNAKESPEEHSSKKVKLIQKLGLHDIRGYVYVSPKLDQQIEMLWKKNWNTFRWSHSIIMNSALSSFEVLRESTSTNFLKECHYWPTNQISEYNIFILLIHKINYNKVKEVQASEQSSLEVPLDCPHEPSGLNWEAHEQKPSPQTHLLLEWQGFQAVGSHLSPTGHCSPHAQLLSPYLLVDAPKGANKTSPYRIFYIHGLFLTRKKRMWFQMDL